jgi:hypothetical protein
MPNKKTNFNNGFPSTLEYLGTWIKTTMSTSTSFKSKKQNDENMKDIQGLS